MSMEVRFLGNTSGLQGSVGQAKNILSSLTDNPMKAVGAGLALAGVAAIAFAAKSAQMAADFQESTTQLVTGAGESATAVRDSSGRIVGGIDMVRQGLLQMSIDTATSTQQLVSGMFMIESAGYKGAAGLTVLKVAAEGAKVGNADLGTTANVLTTILTDYHLKATDAAGAMNALTTTVQSGKMHLQDLASSMGSVLPLASSLGISFPQVAGAIAEMTNSGMGAQRAAMNLANTIRSLAAPNSAATKSMKEVGLSAQGLHDTLTQKGLSAAIQEVSDAVGKKFPAGSVQAVQAFKSIMGGATGYNVSLMLGGKNMAAYENNIRNISGAMNQGKGSVTGWANVQQDFNFQIAQAGQALNVLMINVGTALLPVLSQLIGVITPIIMSISDWETRTHAIEGAIREATSIIQGMISTGTSIVSFFQKNQWAVDLLIGVLAGLGVIILMVVIPPIWTFISILLFCASIVLPGMIAGLLATAGAALLTAAPFILVGLVVAAVVAGIILAIQHWGAISAWLTSQWNTVKTFFEGLWSNIVSRFNGAIGSISSSINSVIGLFNKIKTPVEVAAGVITLFFLPALIRAGVEAAISGAKITASFIKSMIETGTEAAKNGAITSAQFVKSMIQTGVESVKNGAVVTANFVKSMVLTGVEAVKNGAIVTAQFVKSMILTGVEAVRQGAIVTANFIKSLIQTGVEGWAAAGKLLASMIPAFIKTGVEAVIAAAKVTGTFILSMVQAAGQALATAGAFVADLIPAIISFAAETIVAAATAIPAILAGFAAWIIGAIGVAAANIAAFWPVYLVIAAIIIIVGLVVLAITHWGAISAWLIEAWNKVKAFMVAFWNEIVAGVKAGIAWIGGAINAAAAFIYHWLIYPYVLMWGYIVAFWNLLQARVQAGMSTIRGIIQSIGGTLYSLFIQPFANAYNFISGVLGKIGGMIHNVLGGLGGTLHNLHIPGFASGVNNLAQGTWAVVGEAGPELMYVPGGSSIYPSGTGPNGGNNSMRSVNSSGTSGNQTIIFQMDSRELARITGDRQARLVRLRMNRRAA